MNFQYTSKQIFNIEIFRITTNWARYDLVVCAGRVIECHEAQERFYLNQPIVRILNDLEGDPSLGVTWEHILLEDVIRSELL